MKRTVILGRYPMLLLLCSIWLLSVSVSASTYHTSNGSEARDCKRLTASGNPEYPPYLWRDPANPQRLIGANARMIEFVAQELGVEIDLHYSGPWGRTQEEVAAGRVDMIAGAFYTLHRSGWMDYLYPEFQGTRTAVWTRTGAEINHQEWQDLVPYQGVTVINNSFGQAFDSFARANLNILEVTSLAQGLRLVAEGRVDYLIYEDNPGKAYAEQMGISGLSIDPNEITRQNLYLTISKLSPCNTDEFRKQLAEALVKLQEAELMNIYLDEAHALWKQQNQ